MSNWVLLHFIFSIVSFSSVFTLINAAYVVAVWRAAAKSTLFMLQAAMHRRNGYFERDRYVLCCVVLCSLDARQSQLWPQCLNHILRWAPYDLIEHKRTFASLQTLEVRFNCCLREAMQHENAFLDRTNEICRSREGNGEHGEWVNKKDNATKQLRKWKHD